MLKAHLRQQIAAHGTGIGDELDALTQRQQLLQRRARTLRSLRFNAECQGLLGHAVAALECSRATQPGQRVDDQTYMKTRHAFLNYRQTGMQPACACSALPA